MTIQTNAGDATVTESGGNTTIVVEIPNNLISTRPTTNDVLTEPVSDIEFKDRMITRRLMR